MASVCAANSFLVVAAPCWALAPASQGGVGLRTADASCVVVVACLLVLALRLRAPEALAKMPRRAPLRGVRVAGAAGCLATLAAPALLAAARQEGLLPRDSIAAKACVAVVAAAWLVTGRLGRDAAAAAAGAARGGRVRAVAALSDAGDVAGALPHQSLFGLKFFFKKFACCFSSRALPSVEMDLRRASRLAKST